MAQPTARKLDILGLMPTFLAELAETALPQLHDIHIKFVRQTKLFLTRIRFLYAYSIYLRIFLAR